MNSDKDVMTTIIVVIFSFIYLAWCVYFDIIENIAIIDIVYYANDLCLFH